jgi:hypothetical protein
LCEERTREKKTEDGVTGAEAAHDKPPDDEEDSANGMDELLNFSVRGAFLQLSERFRLLATGPNPWIGPEQNQRGWRGLRLTRGAGPRAWRTPSA